MFTALLMTVGLASAARVTIGPESERAYAGFAAMTDRFEVLDVDFEKGLVAFKHIAHPGDFEMEPINCNYAGMGTLPHSGVMLGTWSLKENKPVQTFVVYKPAQEESECMSHTESEANLKAAKAHFLEKGLDITKSPPSLPISDSKFKLKAGPGESRFGTLTDEECKQRGYPDSESMSGIVTLGVWIKSIWVYETYAMYGLAGAGSLKISVEGMWEDQKRFFVLEKHSFGSMRGNTEQFSFSPVIRFAN